MILFSLSSLYLILFSICNYFAINNNTNRIFSFFPLFTTFISFFSSLFLIAHLLTISLIDWFLLRIYLYVWLWLNFIQVVNRISNWNKKEKKKKIEEIIYLFRSSFHWNQRLYLWKKMRWYQQIPREFFSAAHEIYFSSLFRFLLYPIHSFRMIQYSSLWMISKKEENFYPQFFDFNFFFFFAAVIQRNTSLSLSIAMPKFFVSHENRFGLYVNMKNRWATIYENSFPDFIIPTEHTCYPPLYIFIFIFCPEKYVLCNAHIMWLKNKKKISSKNKWKKMSDKMKRKGDVNDIRTPNKKKWKKKLYKKQDEQNFWYEWVNDDCYNRTRISTKKTKIKYENTEKPSKI